ncbi:MAG: cupin domain-containing protein [Anaerolineaceae bacterium]|nr:cupin domain-containing protein [Anaerolineaceae bacterium]
MKAFELAQLVQEQAESRRLYYEFLNEGTLSMGRYTLPAGGKDPQQPHDEDEVYYVVAGQAMIRVGAEDRPVQAGSIVYVAAHVPHFFHAITEDLDILVFFAPGEGTSHA